MLTLSLDKTTEQTLTSLARIHHKTVVQVIADALVLYAEQQEDADCLAIIAEREHETTVSYADVLARLRKDGFV